MYIYPCGNRLQNGDLLINKFAHTHGRLIDFRITRYTIHIPNHIGIECIYIECERERKREREREKERKRERAYGEKNLGGLS
jgi:hypothetical protein